MIKFLDLQQLNQRYAPALQAAARRVLDSGWYIRGQEVAHFEQEFAAFCGVSNAVGVANGLDALTLVLKAWQVQQKLQPGDEVLLPANTFIATALAVQAAGLKPVLVEPDPVRFTLCPDAMAAAIGPRTRAVIPVHLFGCPADMPRIMHICQAHQLLVLEDAAQAHGARLQGRCTGGLADAAAFSFYPGKNLGALGDGGAVTTQDAELATIIRSLGNYGSAEKYQHALAGMNSRLDELQAAFLRVKLAYLQQDNQARQRCAARYQHALQDTPLQLPVVPDGCDHVFHLYVVQTERRDQLADFLLARGIQTQIHYPTPIHRQPAFASYAEQSLPVTERLAATQLSLPLSPALSEQDQAQIIAALRLFAKGRC